MKILYALQGTGNGHITRAKEIIPILKRKGDVDLLVSGNECEIKLEYYIKYKFHGLNFTHGKKGGIDFLASYKKMKLNRFIKEVKSLSLKEYDLIINDFEPVSAWAAKLSNVNIVSLSHQNAIINEATPKYTHHFLEKLILKYYAPSKSKFGFHFKNYANSIFLPIIREKIRNAKVSNKGHYTIYLPAYHHDRIVKIVSKIPIVKWHIFSRETSRLIFKKNITIYPVNEFDFIKSMASSSGVLCGAGFETPSEALFLRKKLLVIPMKNQYEQKCNALALKQMGVTVLKKLNKKSTQKITGWLQSEPIGNIDYKDNTEDIIASILLPYYNQTILPTNLLESFSS
ncbi:MAG: glycosyltransferase family protein [Polaribacter sp.]|jgi:uncharacterized protein (TIGR00661 family)